MVTRAAAAWSALLLTAASGCDNGFSPETLVANLRVLGMRSEPADLEPGQTALLQILAVDPSRDGGAVTTLWVGCDPDPFNLNRSACSDPTVLQDPSSLGPGGGMLPPGVRIIGFNAVAAYTAPAGLFQVLPEGDQRRITGTAGQVLAISVPEAVSPMATMEELQALFARVQARELRSLVALFRVLISENPERNHNPVFGALKARGVALASGAHLAVHAGEALVLDVDAADQEFEAYTGYTPSGTEARTERILAAWYSTSGRFSEERTALREGVHTVFTAPGREAKDPVPESRSGTLYVTLRDTRGGQTWKSFPFFVCDDGRPQVEVASAQLEAGSLLVTGSNLGELLDVVVDGVALSGVVDPTGQRWRASAPAQAPTSLTYQTTRCTSGEVTVTSP